jgi:hypothetical protein
VDHDAWLHIAEGGRQALMIILMVLVYLWCAWLTYGIVFAYAEHTHLALSLREHIGFACAMALFGPIGLVLSWCLSGCAEHGCYFFPRKE